MAVVAAVPLCASQLAATRKRSLSSEPSASYSSAHYLPAVARVNCWRNSFLTSSGMHASQASLMFSEGRQMLAATPRQQFQRGNQRGDLVVHGLFGLGVPELAVIAGVAALLFGPKQLPEIGKTLGKTVKSFSQAAKEFQSEIQTSTEAQAEVKSTTTPTTPVEEPKAAPPATTATSEKDSA
ncbi:unnamed protein product [Sphagnum jensenii]|uniref:Sec-independent protein translocase protein TATA, chloroplastic n=1 Tax=Sphagnum jensenii TaxID=128206 RepID=A0ABP1BA75_9BRYO